MKKLSWQQKLKNENKALRSELREVVVNPESVWSVEIKARVTLEDNLEKAVWFGSTKISK